MKLTGQDFWAAFACLFLGNILSCLLLGMPAERVIDVSYWQGTTLAMVWFWQRERK